MTSPFDLKLYVENGMLKYVVYGTWKGKPKNEYGTISKLKEGYNTGDFSNLTLRLDGGRINWIVKNYKFNIDGINLDEKELDDLHAVKDRHNKVNIYENSAGEKEWVVYYNKKKEEEDEEKAAEEKQNSYILTFELRVYSDWLSVVWTNDPKENKKSNKIKKLNVGFNSGKTDDIKEFPIPTEQEWEGKKFIYYLTRNGLNLDMTSERDLENHLKSYPKLHNKVHFFIRNGETYWSVYFLDQSSNKPHESCSLMFKSRKLKSKSSKRRSSKSSKSSKSKGQKSKGQKSKK